MKRIIARIWPVALSLLTCVVSSSALAADRAYVGVFKNAQQIDIAGRDFSTAGLLVGYEFNQYVALEIRGAKGTSNIGRVYFENNNFEGYFKEEIDWQTSVNIKASYPVIADLSVYGVIGYSHTELEHERGENVYIEDIDIYDLETYKTTRKESGITYGVGMEYLFADHFNIFIDYQILPYFEPHQDVSRNWHGVSIGFSYVF